MQLKKASKKTAKAAELTAPVAEAAVTPEPAAKPRVSKSSKSKKIEGIDMTSGKRHHKPASPVISETTLQSATLPVNAKPIPDVPASAISIAKISQLAYSYWVERGYAHGSAEEDWLRAERELAGH